MSLYIYILFTYIERFGIFKLLAIGILLVYRGFLGRRHYGGLSYVVIIHTDSIRRVTRSNVIKEVLTLN